MIGALMKSGREGEKRYIHDLDHFTVIYGIEHPLHDALNRCVMGFYAKVGGEQYKRRLFR